MRGNEKIMTFKRDMEIHTLLLCITQLCVTEISLQEIEHGRNVHSGNNGEGKILAVTKVLEVRTSTCDKYYVCSFKYFIFPIPTKCSTIVAQIHRVF